MHPIEKRAFYKLSRVQEVSLAPLVNGHNEGSLNSHQPAEEFEFKEFINRTRYLDTEETFNRLDLNLKRSSRLSVSMDSSPVLRQQSQNKIQSDFQRLKNAQNKMPMQTASVKLPHPLKLNENKNPANAETVKKALLLPRVSRLPVPIKNLHLKTPSDFTHSHCKWEEKPLTGKARKKKPCTRPIPFNLSQPRSSRVTTDEKPLQTVLLSRPDTHPRHHSKSINNEHLKTPNGNGKLSKPPASSGSNVDSTQDAEKSLGKTPQTAGHCGPSRKLKTLANSYDSTSTLPLNNITSSALSCVDDMNLLSLSSPAKTCGAPQNMQMAMKGKPAKSSNRKIENFQPSHADLLSILRNEKVCSAGPTSATPNSKPQTYLRVSVKKSKKKTGPDANFMREDHFSPDCAALQSILRNEGVKVAGLVGATPGQSACPSGRSTSMYRRVPVKNRQTEAPVTATALKLRESTVKKCTPQRVPNARRQNASAVKWNLTPPYSCTPGVRSVQTKLQRHQEEVVQRLFEDQEDEQGRNPQAPADQPDEDPAERVDDIDSNDEQQGEAARPLFLQTPHRESVIFFSTGKKLLRAPCLELQEDSACDEEEEEEDQLPSVQDKLLPAREKAPCTSDPTCWITPSALQTGLGAQKTCAVSSAVAMLRKRFPPLEELRLNEEVATYTFAPVQPASGFAPVRPRCGNPLASVLHFEESIRFVPIDPAELLD